jgi:Gpi18-like mannosyltransferase
MAVIAIIVLTALAVRAEFFPNQSGDYNAYFGRWYQFIVQNGRFGALKYQFANYNMPYLYLLTAVTYLPIPALTAIKCMSVVFDFLLGFFAYRIVDLRYPGKWWPILAGAIVLFLPTVVLNSSWWAQADAMYSAFGVGGLYFLLRRRPWLACLFFGLAFAFKLQIIFLFPLLLLLVLRRYVPWRALLLIPAVYVVLDIPALLLGASPTALLTVYLTETNTYSQLTLNAPNIYQYFGNVGDTSLIRELGIALTGVVLLALIFAVVRKRIELTATRILLAGTLSVVLVPYLLPAMHERYFYLADTLTVLSSFYLPRRLWHLPIIEQFASLFSYLPFLLMTGGIGGRQPGGRGGFPGGGGLPGRGGRPPTGGLAGTPGGGAPGGGMGIPTNPSQMMPAPGIGSVGGGQLGHAGGNLTTHPVISFTILSTAMLAALITSLWAAIREFRTTRPSADPQ